MYKNGEKCEEMMEDQKELEEIEIGMGEKGGEGVILGQVFGVWSQDKRGNSVFDINILEE